MLALYHFLSTTCAKESDFFSDMLFYTFKLYIYYRDIPDSRIVFDESFDKKQKRTQSFRPESVFFSSKLEVVCYQFLHPRVLYSLEFVHRHPLRDIGQDGLKEKPGVSDILSTRIQNAPSL